jgi:hypothetical protein
MRFSIGPMTFLFEEEKDKPFPRTKCILCRKIPRISRIVAHSQEGRRRRKRIYCLHCLSGWCYEFWFDLSRRIAEDNREEKSSHQ